MAGGYREAVAQGDGVGVGGDDSGGVGGQKGQGISINLTPYFLDIISGEQDNPNPEG
jgi:hypothetical protein